MSDSTHLADKIRGSIAQTLDSEHVDVVDLVPIPSRGDRMVRIRTLEEALDDFDRAGSGDTVSYLVQVRTRRSQAADGPGIDESLIFDQLVEETYAGAGAGTGTGATSAGAA